MKNFIFLLVLLLGIDPSSFGQVQAIFPNRNSPSKEELKELAFQETAKGFAFRNSLVETINIELDTTFKVSVTRLNEIFDHLYYEEVYLEEGKYKNSGWNPSTKKIVQSIGHKWTGFAWVFRIGTFSIICIKGDCGNILAVSAIRVEKIKQEIVYINKDPKVIRDTVYINGENVNRNNPNNNQRWSASSGTKNYTYWNCWNNPSPNYAPMGGAYNYNYGHYNGGGCNNNASYGTPSNYGYSNSNGTPTNSSWSTPTNTTYNNSNGAEH